MPQHQIGETKTVNGVTGRWDGQGWERSDAAPEGVAGASSMFHPGLGDTPLTAAAQELARTGGQTLKGLLRSPLDLASNAISTVAHPIDAIKGVAQAVTHPGDVVNAIGADPSLGGSMIGQLLMGKMLPGKATDIADVAGRGIGATGRGLEAAATSPVAKTMGHYGALEAGLRLDPWGAVVAAAPKGVELAGQGLQKVGKSLRGLKQATSAAPEAAASTTGGLSAADEAALVKRGISPEAIATIKAKLTAPAPTVSPVRSPKSGLVSAPEHAGAELNNAGTGSSNALIDRSPEEIRSLLANAKTPEEVAFYTRANTQAQLLKRQGYATPGTSSPLGGLQTAVKPKFSDLPTNSVKPDSPVQDLFGYQKDAVQAKIQALRDAVPSASAPPSDLMSAYLKSDTSGRVGNFEMDGVQYHEAPGGSSVSTPKPATTAADHVNEINAGSLEGRTTDRGTGSTPGGWADLAKEIPHRPPDPMSPYAGSQSPVAPAGNAFEAEFGVPEPVGPEPTSSPIPDDMMARRLARLQQVFGGRQ
jgi:hypothetical protein